MKQENQWIIVDFTAFGIPPAIQPIARLQVTEGFCHKNVFV